MYIKCSMTINYTVKPRDVESRFNDNFLQVLTKLAAIFVKKKLYL